MHAPGGGITTNLVTWAIYYVFNKSFLQSTGGQCQCRHICDRAQTGRKFNPEQVSFGAIHTVYPYTTGYEFMFLSS